MPDDLFVIDAVTHAYNHTPENFADPVVAGAVAELSYQLAADPPDPRFALSREVYLSDWQAEDIANMLFRESETDVAVMHPLAISAFKDGYVAVEKAAEAQERWPQRFIGAYACVDPLHGCKALEDLERQVELLNPMGLKLYPTSWDGATAHAWKMDSPELTSLYEKAGELGIRHIAVHKAVPIGPIAVGDAFDPSDLEGAAAAYPELAFEIVHGGLAFLEETAWLLARFPNIYVNMEIQGIVAERRPRTFAQILLGLMRVGGTPVLKRLFWGSGTALHHPRPCLEAFLDFEFPEDLLENAGLFEPIEQITWENKLDMLGRNFAELHDIDIDAARKGIENDEFSRGAGEPVAEPYSTISRADEVAAAAGLASA